MSNYVIIAPQGSTLTDEGAHSTFGTERVVSIVPNVAWAVSASQLTCADVRNRLDAPPGALLAQAIEGAGRTLAGRTLCVVVKAIEYNGYASRDLWEKLEAWERS